MNDKTLQADISKSLSFKLKALPASETLIKLFLFFLPFSQALSLNIGFPLKLSEIFLVLFVFNEATTGNILKWKLTKPVLPLMIFLLMVLVSVIVNAFYHYNYTLSLALSRINPIIDSLLKFFYILLSVIALLATRSALIKDPSLIKYFFWGAIVSCCYGWYLFMSGILKLPVVLLPGMGENSQTYNIGSVSFIRCSTFKEGNYMGFFLLVSGVIAIFYQRTKLAIFFFATIITTVSTTSIFCSLLFFLIYSCIKYKKHKVKLLSLLTVVIVVIALLVQFSEGFRTIFYNKVFGNEDSVENQNDIYSKTDRLNTTLVALEISQANPFLGVGPANFGLHYNHYNALPGFDDYDNKRIPNNIYVEVLSEYGGLAFICFVCFLYYVFKFGRKRSHDVFVGGLIASYLYFFAFPTFTMLFIWVFIGIILA